MAIEQLYVVDTNPEVDLLQAISQGVPLNVQQRYTELHAKLLDETLSEEDHNELLSLVEIIEKANADRLKHLLELAQLRSTTLDALMDQIGIRNIHHSQNRLVLGTQCA